MLLRYTCGDCEDSETSTTLLPKGSHCECGGHLYLDLQDNYLKIAQFICNTCINKNTELCINCERNPNNQ